MLRIKLYSNSIEFNHGIHFIFNFLILVLQLPPDFHIETAILNIHLWLIIDRLNKINVNISLENLTYKLIFNLKTSISK